jgi:hypothetical protein
MTRTDLSLAGCSYQSASSARVHSSERVALTPPCPVDPELGMHCGQSVLGDGEVVRPEVAGETAASNEG